MPPSNGGDGGVLWVNSTAVTNGSTFNAVRLSDTDNSGNSSIISTGAWNNNGTPLGLTVATPMPMYVEGNFNTVNAGNNYPPPAALMSDALTVLSSNWSSANYTATHDSTYTDRTAASTTIYADIMTGNQNTSYISGQQGYGGGVNNLTRFLENWSGQTFTFGGSLVCLWQSSVATGRYQDPGNYYGVPNRNFTFNPFNSEIPPGTPSFPFITKGTWRHY